jgi:hypothetical protein
MGFRIALAISCAMTIAHGVAVRTALSVPERSGLSHVVEDGAGSIEREYHDYDSQRSGKDARTSDCVGDRRAADSRLINIDADARCSWFHDGRSACGGSQSPSEHELACGFPRATFAAAVSTVGDIARHAASLSHCEHLDAVGVLAEMNSTQKISAAGSVFGARPMSALGH